MGRNNAAEADDVSLSYRVACGLLQARQYARLAELLQRAKVVSEQRDDQTAAQVLAMACRLCLACSQCHVEAEWYRRAQSDAGRQERELRRRLRTVLDLLREIEASQSDRMSSAVPRVDPRPVLREISGPGALAGLWERVRRILHGGLIRCPEPRDEASGSAAQDAHLPEVEDAQLAILPDAPILLPAEKVNVPPVQPPVPDQKALAPSTSEGSPGAPRLLVYCLGPFRVFQDDQPVTKWPSTKGKAIFKYLIAHRRRPVVKEILMELFWPEMDPDAARNNLNVAIYGLRQALRADRPTFSHVLYQDDCYLVNPDLRVWVDSEAFDIHYSAAQSLEEQGKLSKAMKEYRTTEALYQGEYMEEDRYEDWVIPRRRRLEACYLDLLDRLVRYSYDQGHDATCMALCHKILAVDACREDAHRRLMRCYYRQGQPYLALRQYHFCAERLKEELDVSPAHSTVALYERIRDV